MGTGIVQKWLFSQLSEPLLINWDGGRWVSYPYYRIKTEICTYKASTTIGCIHGKLVEMTIPQGTAGYCLYAAAANQEAGSESHVMRHHCKQQWQTVNQIRQF